MKSLLPIPPLDLRTNLKSAMRLLPSPEEILKIFIAQPNRPFRLRELVEQLGLRSSQARHLRSVLKELSKQRKILYLKKNHFVLGTQRNGRNTTVPQLVGVGQGALRDNIVTGRLIGHRDGYGFVVPDESAQGLDQDIFIPPPAMHSAMHGDRVEAQIFRAKTDFRNPGQHRLEGAILRVLDRAQKTVVGEFHRGSRYNYVLPFDRRVSHEIVIPHGEEIPESSRKHSRHRQFGGESGPIVSRAEQDSEGLIVDVEITRFSTPTSLAWGRVIEILGRRDEFGVDVEMIIRKYHLPHRFPPDVLEGAESAPQFVSEAERTGRTDFRSLPIVTIDGETAKDFDDAVYVERKPDGNYLLQVHIADVARYVRPGTALDREARVRGTSVYFPDRAVPMLPIELSNGICSLNPQVERLVLSALMEIDAAGRIVESQIVPGVIRSHERMTYTSVHAILSGDEGACRRYRPLVEAFKHMEDLAKILIRRRDARGSIDFDLPEPEIEFGAEGQMTGITRSERNIAHRIIEEFMLAANKAVARYLEQRNVPTLYRIHEKPDAQKVIEFEEIAATFGYSLGIELPPARRIRLQERGNKERYPRFQMLKAADDLKITSRHYQRLAKRLAGKPEERILSYLMLRSLKQARYSEENEGHFALAFPTYTHFTSPIRRYPDLIVHRILKAALREGSAAVVQDKLPRIKPGAAAATHRALAGGAFVEPEELHALGLETSGCERRAADAERELMEWKKVSFMAGRLGDEFEALVISITKRGFFVELIDLFVEGFVPIESFEDPHWIYREKLRAFVHRDSRRAFRLGDRIAVRLDRIDREGNKLIFSVINSDHSLSTRV